MILPSVLSEVSSVQEQGRRRRMGKKQSRKGGRIGKKEVNERIKMKPIKAPKKREKRKEKCVLVI